MKVVVERESFLGAFQMAAAVAPNRSPRAILENVKLEVTEAGSILVATDTEAGIRATVTGIEALQRKLPTTSRRSELRWVIGVL